MKIIIKTTNLKLNQALKNFIEEKIGSLEKFSKISYQKHLNSFLSKGKPKIEAWVEIGKITLHHQKGPFFRAECQMRFPGRSLRATALSQDPRLSITEVKDELQRQLKQYKDKLTARTKRKQRFFKKSLRLHPSAKFERRLQSSRHPREARIREDGI